MSGPWRIVVRERVGSTNHELRRMAHDGALQGTVLVAREQEAGRGRDGRTWESPRGNLYLSALLRPNLKLARFKELSFVTALAVADAADRMLGAPRATLKWPNDVLVGGGKIAGILIETAADAAIVGIGLNVASHPANSAYPATSLHALGAEVPLEAVRDALLEALWLRLSQWRDEGFAAIRADWLARAHPPGTPLRVRRPPLEGRFAGLDPDGVLLLDTADGVRRVVAGEVY